MKIGFVADIQGNLPAFKKVLEHMETQKVDKKVNLGDTVGHMPFPNECIELTVSNFNYILMGECDQAVFDLEKSLGFSPLAKEAISWTAKNTTAQNKEILKELEQGYVTEEGIMFVHGSPSNPFGSVATTEDALRAFANPVDKFNISFVGHTHTPSIWQLMPNGELSYIRPQYKNTESVGEYSIVLPKEDRAIINVGSVGQPRDNDPRASYAIYNTETRLLTYFRIPYSIDRTVGKMQQHHFSTDSWLRLLYGQ